MILFPVTCVCRKKNVTIYCMICLRSVCVSCKLFIFLFPCRYLAHVTDMEATDTKNPNLNYGVVVDCGSSGSRIFVYCWPRHNGNPHDLLDIKQMRDQNRKTVVMKIKPGKSQR